MIPKPPAAVTAAASLPPAANAIGAERIGCSMRSFCVRRVVSAINSSVRKFPIKRARLAVKRARLQRALADARARQDFDVVAGLENLVGALEVAIAQRSFDHVDTGAAQQLDDPLPRNAVEERAIGRR